MHDDQDAGKRNTFTLSFRWRMCAAQATKSSSIAQPKINSTLLELRLPAARCPPPRNIDPKRKRSKFRRLRQSGPRIAETSKPTVEAQPVELNVQHHTDCRFVPDGTELPVQLMFFATQPPVGPGFRRASRTLLLHSCQQRETMSSFSL